MFLTENLVFLELHKTGCTHIRNNLNALLPGQFSGKHNQVPRRLLTPNAKILGSIRNPWDWYVSLWAYGCGNKGAIHSKVTRKHRVKFRGTGWRNEPSNALHTFLRSIRRKPERWIRTYQDANDPGCFRDWLHMINDEATYHDIGEGYGSSPVSPHAGILTYRFLRLFCCAENEPLDYFDNYEELASFENNKSFIDYFIRNESLEEDLFCALDSFGLEIPIDAKQQAQSSPKTNTSSRKRDTSFYYDAASRDLIQRRERLIIDKFNYSLEIPE